MPSVLALIPGLLSAATIAALAYLVAFVEGAIGGQVWFDALVVSIILGTTARTVLPLRPTLDPGIHFAAKMILEIAIVLLGASASASMIADAGVPVIGMVVSLVLLSLAVSYGISRAFGLSRQLAALVACGNSICGNSAIVAAAPVIGARADDIASSIAFTAALGIVMVLLLPAASHLFPMTEWHYGMIAGMTVYAVPQVLAATAPIGPVAVQVGTIIKLLRVLMLGPVIIFLGIARGNGGRTGLTLRQVFPWFIIGFFAMMLLRSAGGIPQEALGPIKHVENILTTISMAALGLSVDLRSMLASGGRVLLAGIFSIVALASMTCFAVFLIPIF